jgi:iron(III) transport system permease protein
MEHGPTKVDDGGRPASLDDDERSVVQPEVRRRGPLGRGWSPRALQQTVIDSFSPTHGTYGLLLLISGLLIIPPLILMIWTSITPSTLLQLGGDLSLSAYIDLAYEDRFRQVLRNTGVFASRSLVTSILLGSAMAWIVARTDAPFKGLIYACVFLQFAVPGMIEVIGWIFLFGEGAGIINVMLGRTLGIGPFAIQSMTGMVFVQTLSIAPVIFLLLVGPFRTIDTSLEEAAQVAGATRLTVYRRITGPLLIPSILSVGILVIIRVIQAFEVPLFLGTPANIRVFTTEIFGELRNSYIPNYARASAFGTILVGLLVGVLAIYYRVTRSSSKFATVRGKGYRPTPLPLGRAKPFVGLGIVILFLLYVAPVFAMVFRSFWRGFGRVEFNLIQDFSLRNYQQLNTFPELWTGVRNSFLIGTISATIAVIITCAAAWILIRTKIRGRQVLDQLISLPIVIPGTVLGLAFLITYLRVPLPIYGTIWIFVLAYVANYSPYAMRYTHPALLQIGVELEESARVSGAKTPAILRRIVAPLIVPALIGSWLYVFFHAFRDLSVASLIYTARTPVVATQLLDMWTDGQTEVLSAYGSLISVVSIFVGAVAFSAAKRLGFRT